LVSTVLAFFLSCVGALLDEILKRKQRDPNERARLALLRRSLTSSSGNS